MKYYLSLFFLLMTVVLTIPSVEATPQQCKSTFLDLLKKYNITVEDLKNPEKVEEFKTKTQEHGEWAQFAQLCNNPQYEECKSCTCGLDKSLNLPLTLCMFNCGCCWGDTSCSTLP